MKKLFVMCILLGLFTFQPAAQAYQESNGSQLAQTIFILSSVPALHLGLGLAHELGHVLAARLLLKDSVGTILIKSIFHVQGIYPESKSGLLNAIIQLSGPVAGFLATYVLLSATNVITELNKEECTLKAIKKGLQKPLFNEDQSIIIKGLALSHMLANTGTLIPFSYDNYISEGEKIRQFLFKK